jgi:hypothetical protein
MDILASADRLSAKTDLLSVDAEAFRAIDLELGRQ